MDRRYVIEQDIVARYLRGELPQEQSEAFETFFLEDPETLEELELMMAIRGQGDAERAGTASQEPDASPVAVLADARATATSTRPGQGAPARRASMPLAAAASLAIGFLAGAWFVDRGPATPPSGSVALLDIGTLRSADALEISIPPTVDYAAFRVAIGTQDGMVDVALLRGDEAVASVAGLTTDGYGDVLVVVPTARLPAGSYRISATAARTGATVFESDITVKR